MILNGHISQEPVVLVDDSKIHVLDCMGILGMNVIKNLHTRYLLFDLRDDLFIHEVTVTSGCGENVRATYSDGLFEVRI